MHRPIVVPPDDAPHLLVVDDDARILALLQRYLTEHGYRVTTVASAAEARAKLASIRFDLLVLDVMMPGESGLDLARSLRGKSDVPILMLTAKTEPSERIAGLESGADDYLGKPFEPRELLLRIGAILKRIAAPPQDAPKLPELVKFGEFVFLLDRGELKRGNEPVRITERERDMLRALARAPGETVPRTDLAAPGVEASERAVDVQVNRLRRKIEDDPANPLFIQTVRGIGYRLVVAP
jgi:two-component system phosphate regulon response regulator OmpR